MIQSRSTSDTDPGSQPNPAPPRELAFRGLGVLTPTRQRWLLRGITERLRQGTSTRRELTASHQQQSEQLQQELAQMHRAGLAECRLQRRGVLTNWDEADEQTIAAYERETIVTRRERHRVMAAIRQQRKREVADEERAFDTAKTAIQSRYAKEKPKVAALQKAESARLSAALRRVHASLEAARQITMGRLGGPDALAPLIDEAHRATEASAVGDSPPPPVGAEVEASSAATPHETDAVNDSVAGLIALADRSESLLSEMRSGRTARMLESYYLPLLGVGVLLAWCGLVLLISPERMGLWMVLGVPIAVVTGVAVHTVMAIPLRRQTRQLHPSIEGVAFEADSIAASGRRASAAKAARRAAELRQSRGTALQELRQQHEQKMADIRQRAVAEQERTATEFDQKLAAIEQRFKDKFAEVSRQMYSRAEATAATLSSKLGNLEHDSEVRRQALRDGHVENLRRLQERTESGVRRGLERATEAKRIVDAQFPLWEAISHGPLSLSDSLRWLPLGTIDAADRLRDVLPDGTQPTAAELPLMLVRSTHAAMVIDSPPGAMHAAAEMVRGVLWRGLTSVAPGQLRLTLLDPVGRGQNFSSLVALGDYDPQLIGHRAWSAPPQIAARLGELTQHVEDVLQTCLRDRYETIESYNAEAGALAEPYRVVAAVGLPTGLTRDGYDSLRALIEGGRRCGVFLILVRDTSQPWPAELPPLPDAHVLRLRFDDQGRLWQTDPDLEALPIRAVAPPSSAMMESLAERIGRAAVAAHRVQIPLDDLIPPEDYDSADSAGGLTIPVGRQGVGRSLEIEFGGGMRQHMLVAGKTGSGKSTLLHALITAAALRYPPDQLHLYLLDFKKGVEFKVYADCHLPHARVIGIESQREFGRSVLERLDAELQQRGELFRGAGVQELAEYRRRTGESLPRILLVVDEFQEMFVRDDRVAQECAMLLDRLVRQGRSFGIHVVLSSQSLSGAYSLPRATLGQMAVRVALQCSEADAALILADDNTAARLLSRPGEAIFNDAGGLVEGNQPFQAAWVEPEPHRQRLTELAARHSDAAERFGAAVIFEGNRATQWTPALADQALATASGTRGTEKQITGLLGEAVQIGPPTTLKLSDANGRNVLCVADTDVFACVLAAWLPTAVADVRRKFGSDPKIVLLDGQRSGEGNRPVGDWLQAAGIECRVVAPREAEATVVELAERVSQPSEAELDGAPVGPPTLVVINVLERFRDLRHDDSFGFSLDGPAAANGGTALQTLLRDGPAAGYHALLGCGSAETLSRWLPRTSHHDLELRIIGRISAGDSAQLIETPEASDLTPATLLLYDDAGGTLEKFRLCSVPDPTDVRSWLEKGG